jgi:hypothetical protein
LLYIYKGNYINENIYKKNNAKLEKVEQQLNKLTDLTSKLNDRLGNLKNNMLKLFEMMKVQQHPKENPIKTQNNNNKRMKHTDESILSTQKNNRYVKKIDIIRDEK